MSYSLLKITTNFGFSTSRGDVFPSFLISSSPSSPPFLSSSTFFLSISSLPSPFFFFFGDRKNVSTYILEDELTKRKLAFNAESHNFVCKLFILH